MFDDGMHPIIPLAKLQRAQQDYTFDTVAAHRSDELKKGEQRLRQTFNPPY